MKNLDDAVQGVGVTGDSSFALKEMSKVRMEAPCW